MIGALFIDLKKTFDSVSHDGLICKLKGFGIEDRELDWFSRSQVVTIGNELSSEMRINSGVPQGSILRPVLFSLYMNDLPSCIKDANTIMYADDTLIYVSSSPLSELEFKLNLESDNISRWLCENRLVLNMEKTEVKVFETPQRLKNSR